MRTLLLGATGMIGSALLDELTTNRHSVLALARSHKAARQLAERGVEVLRGDLRDPGPWSRAIHNVDGIVHAACTFTDDMGGIDRRLIEALIAEGRKAGRVLRFVYTGGVWLYGETGDTVATEDSPFNPLPAFSWMIANGNAVLDAPCFHSNIVHPAVVYDRDGGTVSRFLSDAKNGGPIEVWGSLDTRWPLVHREDLARAYRLVLEQGAAGHSYNVAAQEGVPVRRIVAVIAKRFGVASDPLVRSIADMVAEQGAWAMGPALDQQMSAHKLSTTLGWQPQRTDALVELA